MMTEPQLPNWNELVTRYAGLVASIAYKILGARHDAEDISQDVFKELFERFKGGPVQSWGSLLSWIATKRAITHRLRSSRRVFRELDEEDEPILMEPYSRMFQEELRDKLWEAINELPEQQATVFVLTRLENLTHTEVAKTLGCSVGAVSSALHHATVKLRHKLSITYPEVLR